MLIHTLSYSRSVSRSLGANEERISDFKGSSLTRKKYEKKVSSEVETNTLEVSFDGLGQSTLLDISTNKEVKLSHRVKAIFSGNGAMWRPSKPKRERSSHRLSPRTKCKIRDKIFALYDAENLKAENEGRNSTFTFLTLTMVHDCTDTEAQKCLNKFLTVIRKRYGKFLYIWVAERQESGRIHFHFITNRRFPIGEINSLWVLQQFKGGICHPSKTLSEIKAIHKEKTMAKFFNPVDIREVENIDGLSGYLTGYITKNNSEFTCAAWHCCRGISALFTGQNVSAEIVEEVKNESINKGYSKKKKKWYYPHTKEIISKESGKCVAIITNVVNKKHFKKYLQYIATLNTMVLDDYLTKKQMTQTFLLDRSEYFTNYYTKNNSAFITKNDLEKWQNDVASELITVNLN